ncbi:MAG: tRNA pseudouridine(38-40) synthase TruA [Thermodesulfobacteriota bacterium]|nr:tRNA pseudouridine(38-40) synthase TruA [Thermodesulfobacteriota bacterium]
MRNIKLLIEYDGTNYHGWQVQPNALTIQEVIEKKIEIMTKQRVRLIASGRTDAGVHALGQVANFKTSSSIPPDGFLRGLKSLLPSDIIIKSVEEADEYFHAQFGAKRKTYLYVILNQELPSAILRNYSWHIPVPLDVSAMQDAARNLLGRQDFSSFQAADPDPTEPVREVFKAEWFVKKQVFLHFTIEANGFLKHMVRNIVGTLVNVGRGKITGEDFQKIQKALDRRQAGITAPPQGLFLLEVKY